MNYGITSYGKHKLVKLSCKLDKENFDLIQLQWGDALHIWKSKCARGIERVKFEGCIPNELFAEFLKDFKLAHKITKLNALSQEIDEIKHPELMSMDHYDEELPF